MELVKMGFPHPLCDGNEQKKRSGIYNEPVPSHELPLPSGRGGARRMPGGGEGYFDTGLF